jgi:hypothetical protein
MKISSLPDAGGMASASLCMAHCLLAPTLLVLFAGATWLEELEWLFVGSSVLAAYFATVHKQKSRYLAGIWLGLVVLLTGMYLEDDYSFASYLIYGGSFVLITSHFLNMMHKTTPETNYI